MTAELLRHLAELNEEAAHFTTNPVWARSYVHAARIARLQAAAPRSRGSQGQPAQSAQRDQGPTDRLMISRPPGWAFGPSLEGPGPSPASSAQLDDPVTESDGFPCAVPPAVRACPSTRL